jgi:hypothetical protein
MVAAGTAAEGTEAAVLQLRDQIRSVTTVADPSCLLLLLVMVRLLATELVVTVKVALPGTKINVPSSSGPMACGRENVHSSRAVSRRSRARLNINRTASSCSAKTSGDVDRGANLHAAGLREETSARTPPTRSTPGIPCRSTLSLVAVPIAMRTAVIEAAIVPAFITAASFCMRRFTTARMASWLEPTSIPALNSMSSDSIFSA